MSRWELSGRNIRVGNFFVWEVTEGELFGRGTVRRGKLSGGNCPLGHCPGGIYLELLATDKKISGSSSCIRINIIQLVLAEPTSTNKLNTL